MEPLLESDQYQMMPVLEEALRRRVCSICVDRNPDGTCDVKARHDCALVENLPQITRSISRVHSDNMDEYINAIRENICAECPHQHLDGSCNERDEVRCALDRYLLPIIEVIEEVRGVVLKPGRLLAQPHHCEVCGSTHL